MSSPAAVPPLSPKPPKRLTLRLGLSTAFVTMVLATAVVLCALLLSRMHDIMRADIRQRIGDVAALAALGISADAHRAVRSKDDEATPNFLALKKHLQTVKASVPDLRFAYTIRKTGEDAYAYWIDAETDDQGTHVGDVVEVVTATMRTAFRTSDKVYVEEDFYTDKWGTWLTGYAPIKGADGKLECVVGVDVSAAKIAATERSAMIMLATIAAAITGIVALLGLLISFRIVRPLSILEASMARVRELDLSQDVVITSRFHEIVRMADTLNAMKNSLRSFAKYVPTELVRELIHDGTEAHLGGRRAELSIFFSDIEGFTTLAEATTPEGLAADLAEYFATITGTILESGGTVDKYIGDAVMAFWGAPRPVPDHGLRAVKTALLVHKRLAELNARRVAAGRPPIRTRIGLATGNVVVGNFGYEQRLDYTVMGDAVNLSARLEGLNKYVGTFLIMSEATLKHAGETIVSRLHGTVAVKGKTEGVRIFEPLGEVSELSEQAIAHAEEWNAAVAQYMARNFQGALSVFEAVLARTPDDEAAQHMIDYCSEYLATPPGPEWNGTVVMRSK